MRKVETVDLDGKQIEVREITLAEALSIKDKFGNVDDVRELLTDAATHWTSAKPEELLNLAPSELKVLWLAFRRVNSDFFATAAWLGLDQTVAGVVAVIKTELRKSTADFLARGMAPNASPGE